MRPTFYALLIAASLIGCQDEETYDPAVRDSFVGEFAVTDTDAEDGEIEEYEIKIRKSETNKRYIEILNFADIMNVAVNAEVQGSTLNIPQQVFTGNTYILTLTGQGSMVNGQLNFTYNFRVKQKSNGEEWDMGGSCQAERLED